MELRITQNHMQISIHSMLSLSLSVYLLSLRCISSSTSLRMFFSMRVAVLREAPAPPLFSTIRSGLFSTRNLRMRSCFWFMAWEGTEGSRVGREKVREGWREEGVEDKVELEKELGMV